MAAATMVPSRWAMVSPDSGDHLTKSVGTWRLVRLSVSASGSSPAATAAAMGASADTVAAGAATTSAAAMAAPAPTADGNTDCWPARVTRAS